MSPWVRSRPGWGSEILRHAGYRILEAANGREGVDLSIRHRPDVILMDLSMPA